MKRILLLSFFIANFSYSQTEKSVCFIGNSYTYVNDLPGLISSLATADGNTLIKDQNTPGGYTLEGHSTNTTSLNKITATSWDYVVFQEQSQRPSFPWTQVQDDVFPYASKLADTIRSANPCSIPVYFNTWGRRDGDDQWDSINTFHKMNDRLHQAYDYMSDQNSGFLSPIGIGFQHIINDDTSPITHSQLYSGDGSHPSIFGSYLAACIFYELLFETDVTGNTYFPVTIAMDEVIYLQNVAHHVLIEVDSVNTNYTQPNAAFTVSYTGEIATFTNTSEHAFEYFWDFGDGTTSTESNPIHTYPSAAEDFTVTLGASYCDRIDTATGSDQSANLTENTLSTFTIFPNPTTNGNFQINYQGSSKTAFIYGIDGRFITTIDLTETKTFQLLNGIYIIRIENNQQKLIVQ